ncbi:hypothetical protein JCM21900_005189 [Sporobolomyces salmonicolor]
MLSQQRAENARKLSVSAGSSSRRGKHTSRACQNCRRRKSKCDGKQPQCSTCSLYRDDCTWGTDQDGRRTVGKAYVAALESRVKVLSSLLKKQGICSEMEGELEGMRLELGLDGEESGEDEKDEVQNGSGINRLKLDDETFELTQYGPTSAFQHLPEPAHRPLSSSPHNEVLSRSPGASTSTATQPFTTAVFAASPGAPSPGSSSFTASPAPEVLRGPMNWDKNLPELQGWDEELHDELLSLFFSFFNGWCHWVEEAPFRRDLALCLSINSHNPPSRTSNYGPLLHNAILAIACSYSDDPRVRGTTASADLATRAKRALEDEGERPTLATVEGLLLVGSWHSGNGKQGLGYIWGGSGLRLSQVLGLGIDCSPYVRRGMLSESVRNARDRVMWLAYTQDKLWSSYVGRNPTLLLGLLETPLPSINTELDNQLWPQTMSFGSEQRRPPSSNITITFLHTVRLAALQEQILISIYGLRTSLYSASVLNKVSEINLKLEKWHSDLPDSLRIAPQTIKPPPAHIITLHLMYHFVVILLHRPYYSRHNSATNHPINDVAIKRCNASSARIVSLFELYQKLPGLRYAPVTMTQIAFAAGTTHLLACVNSEAVGNAKKAADARQSADACVRALAEMGKAWQCATQTGGILARLISEWCPERPESAGASASTAAPAPVSAHSESAQQLLDPHSDLAQELLRLGWTPPVSQAPTGVAASTSSQVVFSPPEAPPFYPVPSYAPLSLQSGFASAFPNPPSSTFSSYPPPPMPSHPASVPTNFDHLGFWASFGASNAAASPLQQMSDGALGGILSWQNRPAMVGEQVGSSSGETDMLGSTVPPMPHGWWF